MEVGQGPNLDCSSKEKKNTRLDLKAQTAECFIIYIQAQNSCHQNSDSCSSHDMLLAVLMDLLA
jgi:hypothetical protein